jgi:hypothetical protein
MDETGSGTRSTASWAVPMHAGHRVAMMAEHGALAHSRERDSPSRDGGIHGTISEVPANRAVESGARYLPPGDVQIM